MFHGRELTQEVTHVTEHNPTSACMNTGSPCTCPWGVDAEPVPSRQLHHTQMLHQRQQTCRAVRSWPPESHAELARRPALPSLRGSHRGPNPNP